MTVGDFIMEVSGYSRDEYFDRFGEIEERFEALENSIQQLTDEQRVFFLQNIEQMAEHTPEWVKIHLLSFCMKTSGNANVAEKLLQIVIQADYDVIGEYNKLSCFWQIGTSVFVDARLKSDGVEKLLAELYKELFGSFSAVFGIKERCYIPFEERNQEIVFVFTSQVLEEGHAPTKTLLDRCYILQKYLQKKVFIVNTAMQMTQKGAVPFYKPCAANYLPELSELSTLEFRGEVFEFYQCENNMPDLDAIAAIIGMVRAKKPSYILNIGGSDICADICGMFVPEITVSTVFSKVATSCGEYQIVDKTLTKLDVEVLTILGVKPEHVKRTMFTFTFKEQTHRYTREDLGLPAYDFVLLVVGWRLDSEVNEEFLEMLQMATRQQEHLAVAFMGRFDQYDKCLANYPDLKKKCYNLGLQEDALAVTECCNLYVNPRRAGGGSSVSEALYKGLPAVTLPMGDVSVAAGEMFWVEDYAQMEREILRYVMDKAYYEKKSEQAKKRAEHLMDSRENFGRIIDELEKMMKNPAS